MRQVAIAAGLLLLSPVAAAQDNGPSCSVDTFSFGGRFAGSGDPTYYSNAASPTMRVQSGASCSVGITGPGISMAIATPASSGRAWIDGNRIRYASAPGFAGADSFTVRAFTSVGPPQDSVRFLTFRVEVWQPGAAPSARPGGPAPVYESQGMRHQSPRPPPAPRNRPPATPPQPRPAPQ